MILNEPAVKYAERFEESVVSFTPFAMQKTGILQSQTTIKLDAYSIACVPYQLTFKGGILLCSFSKDEIIFFQRFKGALAGLSMLFQLPSQLEPIKIFCRCSIVSIGQLKGKEGIGAISVELKPCPPALVDILGDYLSLLERLRREYDDCKGQKIQVNPASAKAMGFNNYATLGAGTETFKVAVFSLATDGMEFLLPLQARDLRIGEELGARLYFQRYQFSLAAKVASSMRLPTGVQKAAIALAFSPELVEILDGYRFNQKIAARRA